MMTATFNAYYVFDTIKAADGFFVVDDFGNMQPVTNHYSIAETSMLAFGE